MPPAAPQHPRSSTLLATVLLGLAAVLVLSSQPQAAMSRDTSAPSVPTSLRLVQATETTVAVAWNHSTDNVAVAGYRVTFGGGSPTRVKETQYTRAGLSCGQSYTVEVRAYDRAHNVSKAARAVVATASCLDLVAPSAPVGLEQIAQSETTASLAWQPSSDNVAVAGYGVSLRGFYLETTSETSFVFIGLTCGSTSTVAVRAEDVAGNASAWSYYYLTTSSCGDVTAPSAPRGLTQLDGTHTSMSVAWKPSTDNVGVVKYLVYRDGAKVAETAGLVSGLAGLACGTSYTVGVEAADAVGNRSPRTAAVMSTATCALPPADSDTQPPSAPSDLAVASSTATGMTLTWSHSADNVAVTGYGVFNDGVRVQVVSGTTFTFVGLPCGGSYRLGVEAYDAAGNHSTRPEVSASTSPCADSTPPTAPRDPVLLSRTSTSVTVVWSPSTDNVAVAGYGAYVDGELAGSTAGTTYTFTGLACNTSRTFGLDAYDAAGNRSARLNVALMTAPCGDTQAPNAPAQLVVSDTTPTSLTLSWSAPSASGVAGYDVFANGNKVATVTGTSHLIGSLTCATAYTLGVEAFDAAGNRSARSTTTATTTACAAPLPPAGTPPPAGTLFVSPSGSDGGSCTQAAPCASLNGAYSLAQPGQTVAVAAGTYGDQVISYVSGRDSAAQVTFVPQGQVSIQGNLEIHASGVHVAGQATGSMASWRERSFNIAVSGYTSVEGESSSRYPRNVTIEGVDTANLGTYSSENVTVRDVDVGPAMLDWAGGCTRPENKIARNGAAAPVEPKNVLWERVAIHDQNRTLTAANNNCHYGGLFLANGQGVTIRNSVFEQNVVYNIQVQNFGGDPPTDVTIENNWFGCPVENSYTPNGVDTCDGQPSIQFNAASTFSNWLIRYNSFVAGIGQYVPGASYSNVQIVGNAGDAPSANVCGAAGITYTKNAWIGASCGSSDQSISNPFVSTAVGAEDLRLIPGAGAIDAGDPANFPAADFEGEARSSPPDAGADER